MFHDVFVECDHFCTSPQRRSVDYIEFIAATQSVRLSQHEAELRGVFASFDKNGDAR